MKTSKKNIIINQMSSYFKNSLHASMCSVTLCHMASERSPFNKIQSTWRQHHIQWKLVSYTVCNQKFRSCFSWCLYCRKQTKVEKVSGIRDNYWLTFYINRIFVLGTSFYFIISFYEILKYIFVMKIFTTVVPPAEVWLIIIKSFVYNKYLYVTKSKNFLGNMCLIARSVCQGDGDSLTTIKTTQHTSILVIFDLLATSL